MNIPMVKLRQRLLEMMQQCNNGSPRDEMRAKHDAGRTRRFHFDLQRVTSRALPSKLDFHQKPMAVISRETYDASCCN